VVAKPWYDWAYLIQRHVYCEDLHLKLVSVPQLIVKLLDGLYYDIVSKRPINGV